MDDATVAALAADLQVAAHERVPIAHLSARHPYMTVDDAYRISRAWAVIQREDGRVGRGHKVGLTSRAMQKAAKVDEPDFGALFDDMFLSDGCDVAADRFIRPYVEVELAFVLGATLQGPGVSIVDVLTATDRVVPALEVIDTRVEPGSRRVEDSIADNGSAAAVVLGGHPVDPDAVDLRWVGAIVSRNGVVEETGLGAGVLDHPANGVAWLANALGRWGERLDAGEVVLSGSFTRPLRVAAGDTCSADFGALGTVAVRFA